MILNTTVNGEKFTGEVPVEMRLIDFLREVLLLTGTKEGCGEGECGACTVIIDGKAVNSCLVMAHQIRDKEVFTIESLENDGELSALQESFVKHGAVQCGYCTPGMLMSSKALLMANKTPNEAEIRKALEGNICRCTGYTTIVDAVKDVGKIGDNDDNASS